MNKDKRIESFKAAIVWLVTMQAVQSNGRGEPLRFDHAGCGCCSCGELVPPMAVLDILKEVL